ncbi:ATP-binding protein [Oxalobacteraceae bacterium R-40]|uniref:histidine kinase n=1 Tax=Keguizhuia sedimenti TaxID=3064264 RepID=A0ABU1BNN0_9BURK|nr:ATP-binding protein [Oxalobacteraceae bacterium R-40]
MTSNTSAYQLLIDRSSDAVLRIGTDRRYCYANYAATVLLGAEAGTLIGKPVSDIPLSGELLPTWEHAVQSAFASGEPQSIEFFSSAGQRALHLHASVLPEANDQGETVSALSIIHDLSKRERMEKEHEDLLMRERSARIQAETAARARDEFLAIVSHELRAPLNGIQTWAHVLETRLKDAASSAIAQRAIAGIKTGISQQVRLIDDLLDVTRMMSGKLRLIKHPFILLPVVQAAVQSVADAASAKQIRIECDFRLDAEKIDGDADRIQQALWNLLSNAVKFTPQGGLVTVEATRNDSHAIISVRDNGIGISRDFLPHLFDRFSQEDTSSTRRHNGLGLGLFLVRHLIEMHGGHIRADSPGERQGASFSIELPLRSRRQQSISALQAEVGEDVGRLPTLQGLRILLVDDQEEARESLSMVLAASGANVYTAASSGEIFEWLNSIPTEQFPNVIISDIAMPIEDGYTVLRKLRTWKGNKEEPPLQRVPALALTAFSQREDRIRALTAGFQMHVAKPVAPEELIVVIAMMAASR